MHKKWRFLKNGGRGVFLDPKNWKSQGTPCDFHQDPEIDPKMDPKWTHFGPLLGGVLVRDPAEGVIPCTNPHMEAPQRGNNPPLGLSPGAKRPL